MRYDLALVASLLQLRSHGLGAFAILLRPDSYTMELPGVGRQLAQECRETLFAKVGRQTLGVLLIAEAPQLHRPHTGRRTGGWRRL